MLKDFGMAREERRGIYVSKSELEEMLYNAMNACKDDSLDHITDAFWDAMEVKL